MRFVQIQKVPEGANIVGIEITDAALAPLCAVNIDGQHGMPGTPEGWRGRAAIDIANEVPLPPADAWIAFQRPDLDAIGAAAVLALRRLGLWDGAPAETRARVALVAERDSFRPGGPWAPSPLPTEEQPWPAGMAAVSETRELAGIASICSPRRGDVEHPLVERVLITACWLLWGDPSLDGQWGDDRAAAELGRELLGPEADTAMTLGLVRRALAVAAGAVEISRRELVRAVRSPRALELRCAECGERCADDGWCLVGASQTCGTGPARRVAVVRVSQAGALGIGYCLAPVVLAVDQATPGKYTVSSWTPGDFDHGAFRAAVNAAEEQAGGVPRWGGGAAITGSPQVPGGSRLTEHQVLDAALEACR